jgi:hypothetical protein
MGDSRMISDGLRTAQRVLLTGLIGIALMTAGCSVALNHGELAAPQRTYTDPIQLSSRSEGINGKVGWGRITVFYIPCVPIHVQGNGNEEVMNQIRDALQQAGYKVNVVETQSSPGAPVLKCKVTNFWFNNYTWLFPFVPTWGNIDLTVSLERPGGQTAWERDFHGHGWSANFFDGYSSAANKAMTSILNEMVVAFGSDDFHRALAQGSKETAT